MRETHNYYGICGTQYVMVSSYTNCFYAIHKITPLADWAGDDADSG
jgi:hypothetical protein